MVSPDVCDAEKLSGSPLCGRDIDATTSPTKRARVVCITVIPLRRHYKSPIENGEFMYKRGTSRHRWHPTLCASGVAAMRRGGCLDVQEHTRNARSRSLA